MRHSGISGFRCFFFTFLALSVLICAFVQTSFAETNPMDVFVDGVEAFEAGDYTNALSFFEKAEAMEPGNLEFQYYQALALSKTGNRQEAVSILNRLVEKDPANYRKALFDIAAIYSAQSQYQKALEPLERAVRMAPSDARGYMETGICQKFLKDYPKAIQNLQTASSLDPRQAPSANLIMAAIYLDQEDFDKSEQLFRQVAQTDAGTPVADAAVKSLEAVSQTRRARKAWYVNGQLLWGYDDNVINKPLDAIKGYSVTDEDDSYQNLYVEAGYRVINRKDFRLGASFTFNTQGYRQLWGNNIMSYNPTVFTEWRKDRYFLRFSYDFSYYYTGGGDRDIQDTGWCLTFDSTNSRLKTHRLAPTLTIQEPYGLSSVVNFAWIRKDYCDLTPDAHTYQAGLTQNWQVYKTPAVARVGYQLVWEDAFVSSYSNYTHTGSIGLSCPLPYEITADAQYSYTRAHYDESPSLPGSNARFWIGDRKDTFQGFNLAVTKRFGEIVRVTAAYFHGDNDSNITRKDTYRAGTLNAYSVWWDPYEFRRNTYSLAVSCLF